MSEIEEFNRNQAIKRFGREAVEQVEARGYSFGAYRGEGNTRTAISVDYHSGNVHRRGVMKVPKLEVPTSVRARIAAEKEKDWSLEEILITNRLSHPHLVRPVDAFYLDGVGTVVIEEELGAHTTDAETLTKRVGPFYKTGRTKRALRGVADAVSYLHGKGIVHRDIKPSNVLIADDGESYLSDLQTARSWKDIEESTMPTAGGTAFTHPRLLNALLQSRPDAANGRSDIYSLGATAYAFLTGEQPFNWKISYNEIQDRFVLHDGVMNEQDHDHKVRELEEVSDEEHAQQLDRMDQVMKSQGVSRGWRKLVRRSMTLEDKENPITTIYEFRSALYGLNDDIYESFREKARRAALTGISAGIAASILGITIGGFLTINSCENNQTIPARTPSLIEDVYALRGMRERRSLEERTSESDSVHRELRRAYEALASEGLNAKDQRFPDYVFGRWASDFHGVKPRIAYAVAIAARTAPDFSEKYKAEGQIRLDWCYVPRSFIEKESPYTAKETKEDEGYQNDAAVASILYLKSQITNDRRPLDVFAHFFATSDQIARAQIETQSVSYFPECNSKGFAVSKGYASALPDFQRELINRAAAFYQIIDEKGTLQPSRLQYLLSQSAAVSNNQAASEAADK